VGANTLGLAATALSVVPLGSAMKLTKAGLELKALSPLMHKTAVVSQYMDTLAILNSGVTLQQNWGELTPAQRVQAVGQLGFWGLMTGVAAKQSGSLYGFNLNKKGQSQALLKQQETIANLKQGYAGKDSGGHNFTPSDGGRVNINGQIKIHPDKLVELQANPVAFEKLLKGTKALEEQGGNFSKLSPEDQALLNQLSSSGGQRLRFEYQLNQQVDGLLQQHGVENQPVFRNMNEADRARLFDIINERPRQLPKDPRQVQSLDLEERQAVNYALTQKPKSVNEFVEQVQMYKAVVVTQQRSRTQKYLDNLEQIAQLKYQKDWKLLTGKQQQEISQLASEQVIGVKVNGKNSFAGEAYIEIVNQASLKDAKGNPTAKITPEFQSEVINAYQEKRKLLDGRVGSTRVNLQQSSNLLTQQVQKLNEFGQVRFSRESSTIYHIQKHYDKEFPQSERQRGRNDVDNYLKSASETIRNPTRTTNKFDQEGNHVIVFERTVIDDKGKPRMATAFVKISPDGQMSLASYFIPGSN
jgi:hypothetical protein